jgi:hypothetical protein
MRSSIAAFNPQIHRLQHESLSRSFRSGQCRSPSNQNVAVHAAPAAVVNLLIRGTQRQLTATAAPPCTCGPTGPTGLAGYRLQATASTSREYPERLSSVT